MPLEVLQRYAWSDLPKDLGSRWTLEKRDHTACCRTLSHEFGWELRLDVDGDIARTVVCRSQDDVLNRQAQWREGLEGKGWARPRAT